MEFRQFNPEKDNIEIVADLIIKAYEDSGGNISSETRSRRIVMDLIWSGNNFLGKENIYLSVEDDHITGLVIGYPGKPWSRIKTLYELLVKLKLFQIVHYLIISSKLFDTTYTPYLNEHDFYISVIMVGENYRRRGVGTLLLKEITSVAKDKNCSKLVLEVNEYNTAALSMYRKFGFKEAGMSTEKAADNISKNTLTMEYGII